MSNPHRHFYEFESFRLDVAERVLLHDGELVPLTQKAFDVLLLLVEGRGSILSKDDLMEKVWPDTYVEESSLTQNIYTLRKTLGETPAGDGYIATVPRRGYRFAVPVRDVREEIVSEVERRVVEAPLPVAEIPALVPPPVSSPASPNWTRRAVMGGGALALVGGLSFWYARRSPAQQATTGPMSVTALTTSGNVTAAAIAPDGKYVTYATTEKAGQSSLWLVEPATAARRVILPLAEIHYHALTFSPDGSFVYYVADPGRKLYRVPILGGPPKLILEGVETAVAFSPDGQRMAFRRRHSTSREVALVTTNVDGSDERELARLRQPHTLQDPAWSPDGKQIACAIGELDGVADMYPALINATGGKWRRITREGWRFAGPLAWMAWTNGGRELLMIANRDTAAARQIWRVDVASGAVRQLTNDVGTYSRLSLATQANALVALQVEQFSQVWLMSANEPPNESNGLRQITFGTGGYRGRLAWMPNGRIAYDGKAGAAAAISIMEADGSHQQVLSGELTGRAYVSGTTVTRDGRHIVFASDLNGERHIWRMNADGSHLLQLTHGRRAGQPHVTPDGRWVVFTEFVHEGTDRPTLHKVSMDGGATTQLTTSFTAYPAVSPDGQMIACLYAVAPGNHPWQLALFPITGGAPLKVFPPALNAQYLSWTPDGRFITYVANPTIGTSQLMLQPREGGEPKLLLASDTEEFFGWDWSYDGRQLALVRGLWATNAVLIKSF